MRVWDLTQGFRNFKNWRCLINLRSLRLNYRESLRREVWKKRVFLEDILGQINSILTFGNKWFSGYLLTLINTDMSFGDFLMRRWENIKECWVAHLVTNFNLIIVYLLLFTLHLILLLSLLFKFLSFYINWIEKTVSDSIEIWRTRVVLFQLDLLLKNSIYERFVAVRLSNHLIHCF
jgi:hypothetical protein